MQFIRNPVYIITVLLSLVFFSEWLAGIKIFRRIGSALIVILAAAVVSNLGLLPASQNATPLYQQIFEYAAPLGIFYLLLDVNLKDLKLAGLPMLLLFLLGAAATTLGAVVGFYLLSPSDHQISSSFAIAGMFTGTYSGGSANLNAVALEYRVMNDGTQFAAINAVDVTASTVWIMVTLIIPVILQRIIPRKRRISPQLEGLSDEEIRARMVFGKQEISLMDTSLLLMMGFGTLLLSDYANRLIPSIPSILFLTTIALILAQMPFVRKMRGSQVIGFLLILLFLAVVGAICDLESLRQSGEMAVILLLWVVILIGVHAVVLFSLGGIFKQDWDMIAVASNANIGGTATAAVCASSLGRPDLQLPGLLVGALGNGIGTYLGILVAELLK